jgi:hypothetical protein
VIKNASRFATKKCEDIVALDCLQPIPFVIEFDAKQNLPAFAGWVHLPADKKV